MPFKKGDPKPKSSGRKPGVSNKKSLLVREVLENHGINLAEQIVVRLPKLSSLEQTRALIQLLPYVYPKLTAITHSGEISNPYLLMNKEELEKEVKARLKKK